MYGYIFFTKNNIVYQDIVSSLFKVHNSLHNGLIILFNHSSVTNTTWVHAYVVMLYVCNLLYICVVVKAQLVNNEDPLISV